MTFKVMTKALLTAALLLLGTADLWAQSAPTPGKAPARPPFTAFRTKPILELKFRNDDDSLVVQDTPSKKQKQHAITFNKNLTPRPKAKPVTESAQEDILFTPQVLEPIDLNTASNNRPTQMQLRIPVPPRKPAYEGANETVPLIAESPRTTKPDSAPVAVTPVPVAPANVERVAAAPVVPVTPEELVRPPVNAVVPAAPEPEPVPVQQAPEAQAQNQDVDIDVMEADTSLVRTRASRFSSQQRMGGSGSNTRVANLGSLGLPKDMQNLNIGRLEEGDGVSPVLMPGQTTTKAAPDAQNITKQGLPPEVVVFFQENSSDMEVGQMDVLNSDVLSILNSRPDLSLEITGYSETQKGNPADTKKMSLARALMIRQYLVRQHVSGDRISVDGKGADTKIEPRDRVEMYFDR